MIAIHDSQKIIKTLTTMEKGKRRRYDSAGFIRPSFFTTFAVVDRRYLSWPYPLSSQVTSANAALKQSDSRRLGDAKQNFSAKNGVSGISRTIRVFTGRARLSGFQAGFRARNLSLRWLRLSGLGFFQVQYGFFGLTMVLNPINMSNFTMVTNFTIVLLFHINYLSHFTMMTILYAPHPFSGAELHLQLSGLIYLVI